MESDEFYSHVFPLPSIYQDFVSIQFEIVHITLFYRQFSRAIFSKILELFAWPS